MAYAHELNSVEAQITTLETKKTEILENYPTEITKTDTLEFEYFLLPVTTLALNFLYRFSQPAKTVWQEGVIEGTHVLAAESDLKTRLEKFALAEYSAMLSEAEAQSNKAITSQLSWLKTLTNVKLVECEMTRIGEKRE